MRASTLETKSGVAGPRRPAEIRELLRRYYEARDHLRRGLCLLSAGRFDDAVRELTRACQANPGNRSLAGYLAAAHAGMGGFQEAAAQWASALCSEPKAVLPRIRHALALWKADRRDQAVDALRATVADFPECAEVHFQLGNMLAERGELDEAELRFTTAVTLDKGHADAWVALAMSHGAKGDCQASADCLRKAQRIRPDDSRLALLLAYALKGAPRLAVAAPAPLMPVEAPSVDDADVAALAALIDSEPEFVEAVLSLDAEDVRPEVFALLADTLGTSLERHPEHADLHYHCGCVLARLGRTQEAISAMERAIGLRPRFIKALIQLAKLYGQVDRNLDARRRLEEAIRQGAEYADVYFLLGNLYRDGGMVDRASDAYRRALKINPNYRAAREALLAVGV